MRYYYFAAAYSTGVRQPIMESFGFGADEYPKREQLHKIVKEYNPGARDIIVLSVTEVTKDQLLGLLPEGAQLK